MMRAEVFWYRQMREHTPIAVPDVYFEDFERKQIPTDYFIMEKLSGKQLDQMKFSGSEQVQSNSITATMAARSTKLKTISSVISKTACMTTGIKQFGL